MKITIRELLTFTTACLATSAFAQTSDQSAGAGNISQNNVGDGKKIVDKRKASTMEEVIVTAQKRAERLQDVPISATVLGGNDLDASSARDVTEVLRTVPGVVLTETEVGGGAQVAIRGVAAAQSINNGSSPVAYYLDSVPFGFTKNAFGPDPDAYDLERVEVLRGPQGTLYGANALNGVVRVLTKDADLNEFEVKLRGSTSSTEGGEENYRGDMAVNVPLVDGKLAARAALGYQDLSGWIDKPNKKNVNDAERRTARLKLNALPTERLSIGMSAWLSRADYGSPSFADPDDRRAATVDEPNATDYDAYGAKIGYAFDGVSVTSMTSYLDYSNAFILDLAPGSGFILDTTFAAKTFAQEVIVNSTGPGSWRWTGGAIYRDSDDLDRSFLPTIFGPPSTIRNISKSYAVFGELTRLFSDGQFEVTAGLRYFEDDVTQREESSFVPGTPLTNSDATFSATTPRLVFNWHPSKQMTLYASYGEGFRSGFHQDPSILLVSSDFPPVKEETLANYEVGTKGSIWNGRLIFDAAVYYIDWEDVVQPIAVPIAEGVFLNARINSESASGMGMDFSMTIAPIDSLELGIYLSWNDLTMDADVFSRGVMLFEKGDRLINSAEYTAGATADYVLALGRSGFEGRLSVGATYTSEQEGRAVARNTLRTFSGDPMLIGRVSLSLRAPERWVGTLYVDNVNNERGTPIAAVNDNSLRIRPRTIGAQIEYRY